MILNYRRGAALLASLSALGLTGCHHSATETTFQPSGSPTAAEATVNGQAIPQQEFFTQLQAFRPSQPDLGNPAGQIVLRQLINCVLQVQLAQQQGVAPTDAEVQALFDTQQAAIEAQNVKSFAQILADDGLTPDDVKNYQLKPQLAEINLMEKGQPPITDAQINDYYKKNVAAHYTEPNRVHIKRIVLANIADANRIYSQIQKGQSFDNFLSQSIDRQFPNGDVPFWVNIDTPPNPALIPPGMLPSLKAAAPGTGPASVTKPFAWEGAYWIAEVVDKKPKTVVPLSQVKELIQFSLMAKDAQSNPNAEMMLQQQVGAFAAKSTISIPDPRYSQLLTAIKSPPPPSPMLSAPPTAQTAPPTAAPSAPAGSPAKPK